MLCVCFVSPTHCDLYEGRGCVFVFAFNVLYLHCGVCLCVHARGGLYRGLSK